MRIEQEIRDLKGEIKRIDYSLDEVGLVLNSRGELSKIIELLLQMNNQIKDIEKSLNTKNVNILIKYWNKIWQK